MRRASCPRTARPNGSIEYARTAKPRGLKAIIAGAGGAAHLPGMTASMTVLPVLGVPVESRALKGLDSLLSIAQMPGGVPVATFAIGEAGAKNAGLFAAALLAARRRALVERRLERVARAPDAVGRAHARRRSRRSDAQNREQIERAFRSARTGSNDRHSRRRPARPHARARRRRGSASSAMSISDETESCAFYVADATTRAQYSDERALEKFAAACDVVTFEFENVPDATAHFLDDHVPVAPNARSLAIAQDRFLEKSFIAELGIATAGFRHVVNEVEASTAYRALAGSAAGPKAVLKTQRLGYDGKGQQHRQERSRRRSPPSPSSGACPAFSKASSNSPSRPR